ncbi:hypothetical protein M011DRAFT_109600 [Sporormia fimetaria CBS 119925]|uniref:Uncharacterized protein n=1 Tax=Sporormia fimetaria CBS 119925 TaxID=1340428 RepID=A0A6A6VMB1_9PLEO|nr:hypothetical protein M011DRAFT_109600 [Sporormia fimetaria CBS 119925]
MLHTKLPDKVDGRNLGTALALTDNGKCWQKLKDPGKRRLPSSQGSVETDVHLETLRHRIDSVTRAIIVESQLMVSCTSVGRRRERPSHHWRNADRVAQTGFQLQKFRIKTTACTARIHKPWPSHDIFGVPIRLSSSRQCSAMSMRNRTQDAISKSKPPHALALFGEN